MKPLLTTGMRARGLEPPRAFTQRDLNPPRLPVPPRPRGSRIERAGYAAGMDDEREQRERESRREPDTKYAEQRDPEEREREALAEDIGEPPPPDDQ